jgi:hypothetical protein
MTRHRMLGSDISGSYFFSSIIYQILSIVRPNHKFTEISLVPQNFLSLSSFGSIVTVESIPL